MISLLFDTQERRDLPEEVRKGCAVGLLEMPQRQTGERQIPRLPRLGMQIGSSDEEKFERNVFRFGSGKRLGGNG